MCSTQASYSKLSLAAQLECGNHTHSLQMETCYCMLRYKSEVGQQKILFRGSFGTQKPGGARSNAFDIFMKNAANTNVIHWRGRLLALFESAQPVAMDPYSLKTLGPDLLGGSVKAGASFDFGPANGMAGNPLASPKPSMAGCNGLTYVLITIHLTSSWFPFSHKVC